MKSQKRTKKFERQHIILALKAAVTVRSFDRLVDLVTILEADHGNRVGFHGSDESERVHECLEWVGKVARTAKAIRDGVDVPGCGDPDCRECTAEADPRRIEFMGGEVLLLDEIPVRTGYGFWLFPPVSDEIVAAVETSEEP